MFVAVVVMAVFFMAGCTTNTILEQNNNTDRTNSQQNNTDQNNQNNQDNDTVKDVTGRWIFRENDSAKLEHYNVLILKEDMTFELVVNLYEGMGNINGTYSRNGDKIECKVSSRDFYGFLGDEVEQFAFVITEGALNYQGDTIGMIGESFAVFEREK